MSRQTQWEIESCESSESSESSESESFSKYSWFPAFVWHSDIFKYKVAEDVRCQVSLGREDFAAGVTNLIDA